MQTATAEPVAQYTEDATYQLDVCKTITHFIMEYAAFDYLLSMTKVIFDLVDSGCQMILSITFWTAVHCKKAGRLVFL